MRKLAGPARIDPVVAATVEQQPTEARVSYVGVRWVLTMTRELPHAVERVWSKVTEPEELRKWSPVVPDRPLTSLGPATAREHPYSDAVDAEVLVSDPPHELAHRWGCTSCAGRWRRPRPAACSRWSTRSTSLASAARSPPAGTSASPS
jgi:hypothetical protein